MAAAADDGASSGAADDVVVGVCIQERGDEILVGVASVKGGCEEKRVRIYEVLDEKNLLELEGLLVRCWPRLVVHTDAATERVTTSFERVCRDGEFVARLTTTSSNAKKRREPVERCLARLCGSYDHRLVESEAAIGAVACALEAAELYDEEEIRVRLEGGTVGDAMRLDSAAARAATVFASEGEDVSLCSVLGGGLKTNMGRRELERRLRSPLVDPDEIDGRLDEVQALVEDPGKRDALKERLGNLPDVAKLATKLRKKTATLVDVHRIHVFVARQLPPLAEIVPDLQKPAADADRFSAMAQHALDLSFLPEVFLNPSIDDALVEKSQNMRECRLSVDEAHRDAAQRWAEDVKESYLPDDKQKWPLKLEKQQGGSFVLRSPKSVDEKTVGKHSDDSLEIVSYLKNGVYVTTGALKRASRDFLSAKSAYETAQAALTKELVSTASTYAPVLEACATHIARVDVTQSLAHIAVFAVGGPYCRPRFSSSSSSNGAGVVSLKNARHPCVEQCVQSFIANDYELGNPHRLALVTGPNMGGKSTYIRGLAAIAVMAQVGSFVPADCATLPIFDAVLARVGAGDNLHRGISTFMAEMLEASTILNLATPRSLVVVDELGRGTSTCDGFGLAWAIALKIARDKKSLALFATHFHELTDLAAVHKDLVKNLHVAAQTANDSIAFLYDLRQGPCQDSFGIAVAKLAGFPERALQVAQAKAAQLENYTKRPKLDQ